MEVAPDGNEAYFEHMTARLEYDRIEKDAERKHVEKMKALELGLVSGPSGWPLAFVCAAIGGGVPIGVTYFLWQASLRLAFNQSNWSLAVSLGVPAIISASVLAWRGLASRSKPVQLAPARPVDAKPAFDPETFADAAGRFATHS
jgi:hypothetical protein